MKIKRLRFLVFIGLTTAFGAILVSQPKIVCSLTQDFLCERACTVFSRCTGWHRNPQTGACYCFGCPDD